MRFLHKYAPLLPTLNAKVAEVVKGEMARQFGGVTDPKAFNSKFLEAHKGALLTPLLMQDVQLKKNLLSFSFFFIFFYADVLFSA